MLGGSPRNLDLSTILSRARPRLDARNFVGAVTLRSSISCSTLPGQFEESWTIWAHGATNSSSWRARQAGDQWLRGGLAE